ncbi:unnamed protein product [Bursaphelenchus xylophilus]|uniref:(pine wood nematode) hypothetical protein n=1 Tax=Bursaphelenchus xylophilus TaxID=6326 RepID=A0A1I7SQI8_BURXY|nr:unnamed protein product [Bursaphelenchus xylophilus]CAG9109958.1 unnamed protein product [Bursaphelenchus xylophilus]
MFVKATVLFVILLSIQHSLSKKTTPRIVGRWFNVSVDDPEVQKLAKEAVDIYAKSISRENQTIELLEKVVSAKAQIVAGTNYRIDLIARQKKPLYPTLLPLHDKVSVDIHGKASHKVTVRTANGIES